MKLQFYPYDFEYKVHDGITYVYLYGRDKKGKKVCIQHAHEPFFYCDHAPSLKQRIQKLVLDGKPEPAKVIRIEDETKDRLGKQKKLYKIYTNYPKAVPQLAKEIESWGITCYERDILFIHRYLRDNHISPTVLTDAEVEKIDSSMRCPVYRATSLVQKSQDPFTKWKILALDIETYAERKEIDSNKNPILMVSLYGKTEDDKEFRKVITWKKIKHKLDYLEIVKSEEELVMRLKELILDFDPDILTGYFSDGFDLPYIKTRADKFKITLDLGSDYSELNTGRKTDFRDGESYIRGTLHLDILKFVKYIFGKNMKTESFSLDAVASEILGHKKHPVNLDLLSSTWDKEPDKLLPYVEYNLHDSKLTFDLCERLLFDMIEFSKIVGLPPFDVTRMRFSRLVESYILKRGMEFNILAPNKPTDEQTGERMDDAVEGAFVFEPTPGLYKDIVVFDFRSLYPTIITSHNISPESLHCSCCKSIARVPGREEFWFCTKDKKFLPHILEDLINKRAEIKKQIKKIKEKSAESTILESRSYALKILANSFYGYLGFYAARWYCIECTDSTTAYARHYIKMTIDEATKQSFKVIYADTDSCFMLLGNKTLDDAKEFMEEINKNLPGQMELDFEGHYQSGIFVAQKGSDKGAKKRYALLRDNETLKITGFEAVRRNSTDLAREAQEQVLRLVLHDKTKEAFEIVRTIVKDLKAGKIPLGKLVLKTQLTRDVTKYTSIGPHVIVAQKMKAKGESVHPGMLIRYIIGKGSGLVRDRAKMPEEIKEGEYDVDYYLEHQLIPAVNSIFAVLGYNEEEMFKESAQKGLSKFF